MVKRLCPVMILLLLALIAASDKALVEGATKFCRDKLEAPECEKKKCESSCKAKHGAAASGDCIYFHDPNHLCWCSYPCPAQ